MAVIRSYRDLVVWQRGMDLIVAAYKVAKLLPRDELYGLTSQIRRAAVSVPANIAEGHGRDHLGDYLRFLSFSKGSVMELETELLAAVRLEYVAQRVVEPVLSLTDEISRMLTSLSKRLAERGPRRQTLAPRTSHLAP